MDEGAEISQQGVPLSQASDDQKVIDTRWITLDIFKEYTYTNSVTSGVSGDFAFPVIIVATHNLGYIPVFDYQITSISYSDPNLGILGANLWADTQNIYYAPEYFSLQPTVTTTLSIQVRVYTLNVTIPFTAPTVQAISITNNTDTGYGIEFVADNNASPNISQDPIGEYSFSTRLKPLNILQNGLTEAVVGGQNNGYIIIDYSYPTNPIYQICQYFPNGIVNSNYNLPQALMGPLGFQGMRSTINNGVISITGEQAALTGWFAYIIFKDPIGLTQ